MGFGIANNTQAKAKDNEGQVAEEVALSVEKLCRMFRLHMANSSKLSL